MDDGQEGERLCAFGVAVDRLQILQLEHLSVQHVRVRLLLQLLMRLLVRVPLTVQHRHNRLRRVGVAFDGRKLQQTESGQ